MNIKPETYRELAKHKNIAAIKEANGDVSAAAQTMALCEGYLDLYVGNDDQIVPFMSLGAKGVISVSSNVIPRETHDICELFLQSNVEKSRELQLQVLSLMNSLFIDVNPIPVKEAMNLMGLNVGSCRMPLCDMDEKNREILIQSMKKTGLIR